MAVREVWFGSMGPYIFDDTVQWPDGEYRVGARVPQVFLDDEPTEPEHAVRLSTLGDYPTESEVQSIVLSVSLGTSSVDSVADSYALAESSTNSTITSKTTSLASQTSVIESKMLSGVFE